MSEDPNKDARTQREVYEEARDRLQTCESADSKNRLASKTDLLFAEGDQWDTDSVVTTTASAEKPQLVINFTNALAQRIENNIREDCPRGGAHPIGDGANIDVAEVIEGIGRHVELRSSAADVAYPQAARSAIRAGVGYFRLLSEWEHERSFRKELRIATIRNIFSVYFDPAAIMPAGEDANWVQITTKMRRAEYKIRYPKASNADWKGDTRDKSDRDWEDKTHIRLAEYFRIINQEDELHLFRHPTGVERTFFKSELKDMQLGDFKDQGSRPALRRIVEWYRLNGTAVVEKAVLPGQFIPVFRVEGNRTDVDGEVITRGEVRFWRDPQRMVNYGETAKIMRLGLAPKAPWVAAEGQLDGHSEWDDANQQSYSVLKYKPITIATAQGDILIPPPQRQQPAAIEQGFSELVAGQRSNLLFVAGMPNDPGQDMRGEVVSGRALQRRDKVTDKSHLHYSVNVKLAIAQCWRVMLEWIPPTYKEEGRIQRIIGEDSTPRMVTLNERTREENSAVETVKNDLSIGNYGVAMDAGPSYQTRREEGAENLIELLGVQPLAEIIAKQGADLVFRSIDHPYMQELADRLQALTPEGLKQVMEGLPQRAQSLVKALAAQNQQLQQALNQAMTDLKTGLTKTHLQVTERAHATEEKEKTARHDTLVKAETARHDTDTRAQTALSVAEINAGGKLLDTHAAAGHAANAAERQMLHEAEMAEHQNSETP